MRAANCNRSALQPASSLPRVALLFLAGDLALLMLPGVRACVTLIALVLIASLLAFLCRVRCRRRALWVVPAWVAAGAVYAWFSVSEQLHLRWPEARAGERVLAQVLVENIPVAGPLGWSFDASVQVEAPEAGRRLRARLLWADHAIRPRAGERWSLLISLQPPRAQLNPSAVDLELHYFRERIHAIGSVVPVRLNRRIDSGHRPLTALRERISDRIRQRVADRDAAALISALAVGAVGEMSREQWRVFNATGTTHLVAISGLHVTLFALVALHAAGWLWRFAVWRLVRVPRDVFAACMAIAASTAYSLLAGFSVPTQRTLIMLAAWLVVRSSARACGALAPLSVALLVVLLLDPFAPLAAGFWLSFGAICAIGLVTQARLAQRSKLREALSVQTAVSLALAPVTLASFSGVSLAGLAVNAVAIPLVSGLFVPLVLLSVVLMPFGETGSGALLDCAAWLYELGWPWLVAAADSPLALVYASPPWWWYPVAAAGVGIALMPWPLRLRIASVLWLVPLATAGTRSPNQGGFDLTMLDVGQGTSVIVRTANHVLVYDAGDVYGSQGRAAERALVPFLRGEGIVAIDRVVISRLTHHGSPGLTTLLASLPVGNVMIGGSVQADFAGARPCLAGEVWIWDQVRFEVLHPAAENGNAGTCVLRITAPGGSVLLPGNIDRKGEANLIRAGLDAVDVIAVPRNGSDLASSPALIEATRPRWALVSGRRYTERGEKPAIRRWHDSGAKVLATGDNGAIRVSIDHIQGVQDPLGERDARLALWRAPPGAFVLERG